MKRLVVFGVSIVLLLSVLTSCNESPLLVGDYVRMEVVKGATLVHETTQAPEIEKAIKRINGSPREETHTWELPEPIGAIGFYSDGDSDSDGTILPLFENGVLVDGYFVEVEFDFLHN